MKYFRRKRQVAGMSMVLSAAMLLNAIITLPVMAIVQGAGVAEIDPRTGNVNFREERLSVPCPGIDLEFNLKYQSRTGQSEGRMGTGWHHNYEWSLDLQPTEAILYTDMGREIVFPKVGNGYGTPDRSNWELQVVGNNGGYLLLLPGGVSYSFGMDGRLTAINDAWGNQVTCAYDANTNLTIAVHSNGRFLSFHNKWIAGVGEWRVSSVWAVYGAGVEFAYNSDGQFTQVVERVGSNSSTSSYYYANGFLTNKVDAAGHETSFAYEPGATGRGTHLDVDGFYAMDLQYPTSSQTDIAYHRNGKDQRYRHERDSSTGEVVYEYGPSETVSGLTASGEHYEYAPNGTDRTKTTRFDSAAGRDWVEAMAYDDTHNMTNYAVAYGAGSPVQQFAYEYDPDWQLPSMVKTADGARMETLYTNGLPLVEKAFYTETNSHDTCYSYTADGLLLAVTNANSHVVSFGYDSDGNQTSVVPETGPSLANTYDPQQTPGFVQTSEILAENGGSTGRITQYGRDAKGRIERIVFPDGLTNSYSRNALGWITNVVDRAGRATNYTYAPGKRIASQTRYLEENGQSIPVRTGFDLDEQANVLRISEPRGRYVESYRLDIQDRVTSVTNIEGQAMDIDYGVGDFVKQVTRFDQSTITNAYDNAGRLTNVVYSSASVPLATVDYTYWSDGQPKTISDASNSVAYKYDALNRLTNSTSSVGNSVFDIRYSHDSVGNVTNTVVSVGGSQASATSCAYDNAERLTSISTASTNSTPSTFVYAYNPTNGLVASISNTLSGIVCSYEYDLMDRATNIAYKTASGTLIRSLGYGYDDASMITNKSDFNASTASTSSTAYTYDTLNRLVGEHSFTNGVSQSDIHYSYDLAGNRLSKTVDGLGSTYILGSGNRLASTKTIYAIDYSGTASEPIGTNDQWGALWVSNTTANAGWIPQIDGANFWVDDLPLDPGTNQLVAAIRDAAGNVGFATNTVVLDTPSVTVQYQYSDAGCLVGITNAQQVTSLDWDERYRLESVSTTSTNSTTSTVSYSYDVLNRRVSRTSTAGGSPATVERYVYDGDQVVADLDDSGNLLRTYVWGQGIDNLLSFTDHTTSNTYYAIKDHQNTVLALTDENGSVVESYEYDAYGTTRIFDASGTELTTSALGNRYLFQGREYDSTTGLYYFRARWYDPGTGRWLSKDPIGIKGGLNQYEFCASNPVMFVDPTGLDGYSMTEPDISDAAVMIGVTVIAGNLTCPILGGFFGFGIGMLWMKVRETFFQSKDAPEDDCPDDECYT